MHEGQTRTNGLNYITHPVSVCSLLKKYNFKEEYLIAALFHDLLEDTSASHDEILKLSNDKVLDAVIILTKEKNYNMDNYINRIKKNKIALMVKLADRIHNLSTAIEEPENFRKRYYEETVKYYMPIVKNTVFEEEMEKAVEKIKKSIID